MIEPICWIRQDGVISFHKQKEIDSQYFKWHPLYTHPMRELSDEEINEAKIEAVQEYYKVFPKVVIYTPIFFDELFARALLKKASEK